MNPSSALQRTANPLGGRPAFAGTSRHSGTPHCAGRDVATQLSAFCPHIPGLLQERYLLESAQRRALHNQLVDVKGAIRVFCRVRPLSGRERQAQLAPAVQCDMLSNSIEMVEGRWGPASASRHGHAAAGHLKSGTPQRCKVV